MAENLSYQIRTGGADPDEALNDESTPAISEVSIPASPARSRQRRRQATVAIVIGFVLLVGAMLLQGGMVWQTRRLIDTMQTGRTVLLAADAVFDSLLNAESGQRGFLVTSDQTYLASYEQAARQLPEQLQSLQHQAARAGDPAVAKLVDQITALSRQKMDELAQTIALEQSGQHDQALAVVRSGRGEGTMNAARAQFAALHQDLEGPLAVKRVALASLQSWLMLGVLGAMIVACGLAGVLIRASRKQLRTLELRENALRRLAGSLERRVEQRTCSLADANLRFQAALRASNVTVFTQNAELRFTWTSKDLPGIDAEQVIGRQEDDVLPTAMRTKLTPIKQEVLRTGDPARTEIAMDERAGRRWFDVTVDAQRDADGRVIGVVCALVDITEQKERESRIRLLMRELTHRSKNLLTVIDAIARQTAANSGDVKDFLSRFRDRLQSLAGSHDQLVREDWQGAWLRELVLSQLGHYFDPQSGAITIDGPRIRVQPEAAQHIGLAMHELATNAAKYGALSSPNGRVRISWDVEQTADGDPICRMGWQESGGPLVEPPKHRGFGHVVIERTVARALGGHVKLEFSPEGVRWTLTFPAELVTMLISSEQDNNVRGRLTPANSAR